MAHGVTRKNTWRMWKAPWETVNNRRKGLICGDMDAADDGITATGAQHQSGGRASFVAATRKIRVA